VVVLLVLNIETQTKYLEVVQPYLKENKVQAIRLSTRPDYINEEILDNLKFFGVKDIELGAQSLDDEVLSFVERGHNAKDVENASKMINSYGFNLGLQMMIGLPLDTIEKSKQTAKKIIVFKCQINSYLSNSCYREYSTCNFVP
jgi:histone acetyltransferase (RNA polymerase elongator complex component)